MTTPEFSSGEAKLANGQMTDVMVLGTPHLSQLPNSFDAGQLGLLKGRLASWRPQAIAIEAISGLQCAYMRGFPQRYSGTTERYCPDIAIAHAATGLDVIEANAAVEALLSAWPASPAPAQRRSLAAKFLAAGEPTSALVQWLRLPVAERRAGDGLNADLVAALNALQLARDEGSLIAAPLAANSGLERVYAMDDHTSVPIGYGKGPSHLQSLG